MQIRSIKSSFHFAFTLFIRKTTPPSFAKEKLEQTPTFCTAGMIWDYKVHGFWDFYKIVSIFITILEGAIEFKTNKLS